MTSTRSKRLAVDLFSGAGGLSRGLTDAGFRVIGAVEISRLASESYKRNFPYVTLWQEDIRRVAATQFQATLGIGRGQIDLLAACPPCEGFSTLRTMNGARKSRDPRNDLILELPRFVRRLRPKAILIENVPGLADDARMRRFIQEINALGYEARCEVVNAADYGVPQRRRRMLLVASRLKGLPAPPVKEPQMTVRDWIEALPAAGTSGDPLHDHGETRGYTVANIIRQIPADGGSRRDLPPSMQLACHQRCDGFKDVYGRMWWDRVAPTITSGCVNPSKGRFLHRIEHRTITLREAALLQTFPLEHYFSLASGKFPAAAMIGDALPPRLVQAQAATVLTYLNARDPRP